MRAAIVRRATTVALMVAAGCVSGHGGSLAATAGRDWPNTLAQAEVAAKDHRYADADRMLADFATRYPGTEGGIESARMHRERKIAKDQPHAWMVFFYQLIEKRGKSGTGRALEVAELFQCNRRVRVATNVNGFNRRFSGHCFICGNRQVMRLHCRGGEQ